MSRDRSLSAELVEGDGSAVAPFHLRLSRAGIAGLGCRGRPPYLPDPESYLETWT